MGIHLPAELGTLLTAMVTPFDAAGQVDEESTVALMHRLISDGSDGIVVAGTTGEVATLTDEEQLRLIKLAVDEVGDRCVVVAGTGSNDTRHAVELTEAATELGAHAVLSVTPYYVRPNQRGIKRHFEEVAKATDKPVILYNIPSRCGIDMPNELLAELAQIERIDAVKQARETDVQQIDGLELYAGNDDMLRQVLELGGPGGICVSSHVVGPEMRRMIDHPAEREQIDARLADIFDALFVTANPIPVKAALNLLGQNVGGLRLPMVEADEHETSVVQAALERHGLLQAGASASEAASV